MRFYLVIILIVQAMIAVAQPFQSDCFDFVGATDSDMVEMKMAGYHRLVVTERREDLTTANILNFDTVYVGVWDTSYHIIQEKGLICEKQYYYYPNGKRLKVNSIRDNKLSAATSLYDSMGRITEYRTNNDTSYYLYGANGRLFHSFSKNNGFSNCFYYYNEWDSLIKKVIYAYPEINNNSRFDSVVFSYVYNSNKQLVRSSCIPSGSFLETLGGAPCGNYEFGDSRGWEYDSLGRKTFRFRQGIGENPFSDSTPVFYRYEKYQPCEDIKVESRFNHIGDDNDQEITESVILQVKSQGSFERVHTIVRVENSRTEIWQVIRDEYAFLPQMVTCLGGYVLRTYTYSYAEE